MVKPGSMHSPFRAVRVPSQSVWQFGPRPPVVPQPSSASQSVAHEATTAASGLPSAPPSPPTPEEPPSADAPPWPPAASSAWPPPVPGEPAEPLPPALLLSPPPMTSSRPGSLARPPQLANSAKAKSPNARVAPECTIRRHRSSRHAGAPPQCTALDDELDANVVQTMLHSRVNSLDLLFLWADQ